VREQREIFAGLKVADFFARGEEAEFDEVIAAAAGAKLRPGALFILFCNRADRPIFVHDRMLPSLLVETRANAESRLGFNGLDQRVRLSIEFARRPIEHRHLHAASDVHADRIRNHSAFNGQHAADRQPITDMRVGHERALHGNRQKARAFHLHDSFVLEILAPLFVGDRLVARRRRSFEERTREFAAEIVFRERSWIGQHRFQLAFQFILLSAEDEFGNKRDSVAHWLAQRDAEFDEIF
jgi:hypothetical protein